MIAKETLTKRHLDNQVKKMRMADPAVLERTLHAFVLLERLALSNIPFLFKGGTSLLLALKKPGRVSVDIDIVCKVPKEKFEARLKEWVKYPPFTRWENDVRESDSEPPTRRHYKVFYRGKYGAREKPHYILLDVVEEDCGIATRHTHKVGIDCAFLALEGTPSKVRVPTVDALLGDKLTAFAPNTTGVPFRSVRRKDDSSHQVFKQLFDVAQLFDVSFDFAVFRDTFQNVVSREGAYKGVSDIPDSVLRDIIRTAFDITTFDIRRKKLDFEYENLIRGGIDKMSGDLVNGSRFGVMEAKTAASKAAYLAALLLAGGSEVIRFADDQKTISALVRTRLSGPLLVLDKLKKANAIECYFYWWQTVKMLPDIIRIANPS